MWTWQLMQQRNQNRSLTLADAAAHYEHGLLIKCYFLSGSVEKSRDVPEKKCTIFGVLISINFQGLFRNRNLNPKK